MNVDMNVQAMNSGVRLMNGTDSSLAGLLGSGDDFASILSALSGNSALSGLLGGSSGDLSSILGSGSSDLTSGQLDMSGVAALYGLDWQSLQTSMMLEAMNQLQSAEKPVVTDPELLELLNRMSQLENGEGNDAELLKLIEQMQKRLQAIAEEQGGQMASQQMLAMMSQLGQQLTGAQMSDSTLEALSADGGEAMLQLALTSTPEQLRETITNLAQPGTAATPQTQQAQEAQPQLQGEAELQTAPAKQSTAGTFEAAVRTAKQQLSDHLKGGDGEAKQKLDIDALQARVDAGAYLRNTALASHITAPEAPQQPVQSPMLQLADVLKGAIQTGEQQLTVKLSPEDLGEVTIQLTKTAEGMSLNIIAKNPETQAMLAAQVDQLREAMKPMDVDVEAVLSQQQYELMNGQQQDEARQRQYEGPLRGAAYYGDEPLAAGTAEAAPIPVQAAPTTALDTYI